jgi:8-oxo-dGTP pyrophosphatase MutT (NUDIX family)
MNTIEAHGMVIVYENKLLVTKDNKDAFYKIPGGRIEDGEAGIETAIRELKEETGLIGIIGKELSTQILTKNPTTEEEMEIKLYHYKGELKSSPENFNDYNHEGHEVKWLPISEIDNYEVAPNIRFLIEKGDIK